METIYRDRRKEFDEIVEYIEGTLFEDLYYFEANCRDSIWTFFLLLTKKQLLEAASISKRKIPFDRPEDRFKYFCGICWRIIKYGSGIKPKGDNNE